MSKKDCKDVIRLYSSDLDGINEHARLPRQDIVDRIKTLFDTFIESDKTTLYLDNLDDEHTPPMRRIRNGLTNILKIFGNGNGYFVYKGVYLFYDTWLNRTISKTNLEDIIAARDKHYHSYDQYPNCYESQVLVMNSIYGVRDLEKILNYTWMEEYTKKFQELEDKLIDIEIEKEEYFTVKDTLLPTDNCRPD